MMFPPHIKHQKQELTEPDILPSTAQQALQTTINIGQEFIPQELISQELV